MALTLDHIFIITKPGAAVGDRLLEQGLLEGPANTHPGQGTANRRFFFNGFVLELLFVCDTAEAETGAGRDLGILQRSHSEKMSPFGLVARVKDANSKPAFDSWCYYPDYFNGSMCFYIGANSSQSHEPLCICMPPSLPVRQHNTGDELNPDWHLTGVEVCVPVATPSSVLEQFSAMDKVTLATAADHHLELVFNHSAAGKFADLRPDLPLALRW